MTRHIQDPREPLYAEAVCGDPPTLTGGTGTREGADCLRCIGLYDQKYPEPHSSIPTEGVTNG